MCEHGNGSTDHFGSLLREYYRKIHFEICDKIIGSILDKLNQEHYRKSHQKCSMKKKFLKNLAKFTRNTCARVSFLIKLQASSCNFVLSQVFSCEFCEIFKNFLFTEPLLETSSKGSKMRLL